MSLRLPETSANLSKWSATNPWKESKHTPGSFPSSPQPEHELEITGQPSLAQALRERRQDYIRKRNIKIKIGTWNVAAISDTYKDLPSWFLKGLGVKGLRQDLAGLSLSEDSAHHEDIESVSQQEARSGRKQATVPKGEVAAVPSDDDVGLYVLGLQELVDNSSLTEAMRPYYDPHSAKKWTHAVKQCLPHGYVKVAEQQLLGLLILIYAAPEVAPHITSVDCQSVGTGALGYVGNKGAVSVRLVLGGTTRMLFVNSHLAAGADQASLTRRLWDTSQILSRTRFSPANLDGEQGSGGSESINDEDFAFWFGDLNFRLDDIPGEDVRRLLLLHTRNEYDVMNKSRMRIDSELGYINADVSDASSSPDAEDPNSKAGKPAKESSIEPPLDPKDDPASLITTINSLLQHDQLRAQQRQRKAFHDGWREGDINFLPTYKYDIGSVGMFDSGEKKRSPSWCDRILYRTRQDKLEYEERTRQENDNRKRDEDMKARGLDTDSAEQDVLFDYDPESDGVDDYDEYDEAEDHQDSHSAMTTEQRREDTITLENYVAHQRVLSSDHKPLSAVFNLIYDAIIPELKAQVQQDVARILDKNENDTRPSVTVVIDNPVEGTTHTDRPTGASELNSVEFDEIRFHVPKTQILTIANTGPIPATFAFIDRPVPDGQEQGPFPSWMDIKVHHEDEPDPKANDELGMSTRFVLSPGDIATVDITIDIEKKQLVRALNQGVAEIDEILVLRVLHGRDHFVSVKGRWCPSSYYRYLDELVRFPKGVRSVTSTMTEAQSEHQVSETIYHSAPKELFELTEALPGFVERAVADWTMTNQNVIPPWDCDSSWPFRGQLWEEEVPRHTEQLANLREALDTATPLTEHLDEQLSPLARVELLAETLVSFLQSLQDGIVPAAAWQSIEQQFATIEKSTTLSDQSSIQEIVMDALSTTPVHSVALTFVTFMLTRIVTELCSCEIQTEQIFMSPQSRRARSSTEASEVPSELSTTSAESTSTRSSFLQSLSRRKTGTTSAVPTPTISNTPADRRKRYVDSYSEFWANIIIRSERDTMAKGKDKKTLDARKKRIIAALLDSPSM